MEVISKQEYTYEKQREVEKRGGTAEAYTVNGEEWYYIIYPMVPAER